MPAAKGKGRLTFHRYRPASEYDDATLAQKREYWRNKKREQRARLSEQRRKPRHDSRKEKIPYLYVSAGVNASLSDSALSPPFQSNDDLYICPSRTESKVGIRSTDAAASRKDEWLETNDVNTVFGNLQPTSCSVGAPAEKGSSVLLKSPAVMSVSSVAASPTSSRTGPSTSLSVPLVRVTKLTNGSSMKTEPQPCASMQGKLVPKTQLKAQVLLPIQIAVLPTKVATDTTPATPHGPVSIQTKGQTARPQSGTKSALITTQRAKGVCSAQPSLESEEEKAAKRREHWRIKKREQRAKLAKVKERTQSRDVISQKLTSHRMGLVASSVLPTQLVLRGASQKQCAVRVKVPIPAVRQETANRQSGLASVAGTNLQINQVKAQSYHGNRVAQTAIAAFDMNSVKKPAEPQRNLHFVNHSVPRGIARCKTPRQRFIDMQRNFMNQRNLRYKPPLMASTFPTTGIPKIDPKDTPEQIIVKRREYWRVKKREQRAKLSMEMKTRAREKDSLIRRVKRYQQILAEMRKARALAHSTGSAPNPVSETIGGFIKEDGTLTANVPKVLTNPNTAGVSKNMIIEPQHRANMKRRGVDPMAVNQPLPPHHLCPPTDNNTPRLLLIKPQPQLNVAAVPSSQLAAQRADKLTFSQPRSPHKAGSKLESNHDGCVMKMAVSSRAPSLPPQEPGLTEEEKMAKKREYWRIKKREQRAARAVRLKHGVLQARSSAALLRRRAQRQELAATVQMSRSLNKCTSTTQDLLNNSNNDTSTTPAMPHVNEIKQESQFLPAADLDSPTQQAICPDIKPPTFPPAPPAPQLEPDPCLSTDSQATTLLAVASMKKLLEESLSTVSECHSISETSTGAPEQDVKPDLSQLLPGKSEASPVAPDSTVQIKCWEPGSDELEQKDPLGSRVCSSPQISEALPPLPACSEVVHAAGELSSQTPPKFTANPSSEASSGPTSPPGAQMVCSKETGPQSCRAPEPPKLHHIPALPSEPSEPQQQSRAQERYRNNNLPPAQRSCRGVAGPSGLTSLQKKREYWKLMKRQQRARLRAQQKEQQGESSCQLFPTNSQTPCIMGNNFKGASPNKAASQSSLSDTCVTSETRIPEVLLVSPTTCDVKQSADTVQVKLPITSREEDSGSVGSSQNFTDFDDGAPQCYQEWTPRSTEISSAPSLPALKPPDNPLSSIYLQSIEFHNQSLNPALSPTRIPCGEIQSPTNMVRSPAKLGPASTLVPPKPIPGESEEDFLRRKREYWRVKKKEQRARKAIQDKGVIPRTVSNNWRPILPVQDLQAQEKPAQDSGPCVNSSEDSEHLLSMSMDPNSGPFPQSTYSAPIEDESELLFADFIGNNDEEGPLSEAVWRNRYLMDYNPLNQLLVCMVCGELQYSHSLDGVRAHIDEVHPHTLTLEPRERQRILEAWDEQVSKRERFFTSQLQQQQGGALAESYMN
ncbi:uncharacterized protein si:dkey-28a3.2 [Kryptolebias marmoratus]|uniref:uncharacterized protein si:dkey-28a3.2 n=1 Tax=Kryptolebias marmoratus TaxID=37003 RepID=UPI0007F87B69|nr:uncharacterized protein si:dkey-28a3.2 [Kryptolebias marmoratus]XP_017282539.1 uncharacterized protein si:dkey-28a3.2 [Kryptolebias marmoratus]XP_017282540.1 uncharacterized protein si:dkey-28a3.2 [Kryptolebias marmoratus]XP_037832359.1 uncharacterized protein si:dkey-28a3.2 [Kryptolebias marmoratus]